MSDVLDSLLIYVFHFLKDQSMVSLSNLNINELLPLLINTVK